MARCGALEVLVQLLRSENASTGKQAAKAIANLAVNAENKARIRNADGLAPLIKLAGSEIAAVQVEAIAALANLSVDDENERLVGQNLGGIDVILNAARKPDDDLRAQCARALRNLSCQAENQEIMRKLGGVAMLQEMALSGNEKARAQSAKALANLSTGAAPTTSTPSAAAPASSP